MIRSLMFALAVLPVYKIFENPSLILLQLVVLIVIASQNNRIQVGIFELIVSAVFVTLIFLSILTYSESELFSNISFILSVLVLITYARSRCINTIFSPEKKLSTLSLMKSSSIIVFFVIITSAFLEMSVNEELKRSKGFGDSGTYGGFLISLYVCYFYWEYSKKNLSNKIFLTYLVLWFAAMMMLQMRAYFVSVCIFLAGHYLISNVNMKKINLKSVLAGGLVASVGVFIFASSDFTNRFIFKGIDQSTSGRSVSQEYLIGEISKWDFSSLLFGAGVGSVKNELEYSNISDMPHNDLFYTFYDMGALGLTIVLILLGVLLLKCRNKIIYFIFIISIMTTNTFFMPQLILLAIYLMKAGGGINENNSGISNKSIKQ